MSIIAQEIEATEVENEQNSMKEFKEFWVLFNFDFFKVCPMIHMCPHTKTPHVPIPVPENPVTEKSVGDKPNCPLCLFGITQIYNVIKDNKTEVSWNLTPFNMKMVQYLSNW